MESESYVVHTLRKCLEQCRETAHLSGLTGLEEVLQKISTTIGAPMQLAVFGKLSSSKSTFVNAMLGSEVVGMGQMAETYNVSWLKYGSNDSDIKIVFKNGKTQYVPRGEWKRWSGQAENELKGDVKYIEVGYEHEVLKDINIIDTPGLDSSQGVDSKNTIDFLKDVHPDAVVMVFTKAVAQSTVDVLNMFQGAEKTRSFRLSPLNAIGLYSKVDTAWNVLRSGYNPVEEAGSVITGNIFRNSPELKRSLYAIYPICSLMGLASSTLSQSDVDKLRVLSQLNDDMYEEMMMTADDFDDSSYRENTGLSSVERRELRGKLGLYGIHVLTRRLKENPDSTRDQLRTLLAQASGFRLVQSRIITHFGERAVLIKTQNIAFSVMKMAEEERHRSPLKSDMIAKIEGKLLGTLMDIQEYRELDYLQKLYDTEGSGLDKDGVEEFKRVCGERGGSVVRRLDIQGDCSIVDMLEIVQDRRRNANRNAMLYGTRSPKNAELYKMLNRSYSQLAARIDEMFSRREDAVKVMKLTDGFFYGD